MLKNRKGLAALFALLLFSTAGAISVERLIEEGAEPGGEVDIRIEVDLEGDTPSSLIVTESIPAGWEVLSSKPNTNPFEGKIKWLLYGSSLEKETLTLRYALKAPADFSERQALNGEWKTLSGEGLIGGSAEILEKEEPVPTPTPEATQVQTPTPEEKAGEEAPPAQPDYTLYIIGGIAVIVVILLIVFLVRKK